MVWAKDLYWAWIVGTKPTPSLSYKIGESWTVCMQYCMNLRGAILLIQVVNMDEDYISHFLRVAYQDFPSMFAARVALEEMRGGHVEVDLMR